MRGKNVTSRVKTLQQSRVILLLTAHYVQRKTNMLSLLRDKFTVTVWSVAAIILSEALKIGTKSVQNDADL